MKIRILIYLAVLLLLITACNSASTDVEKISTVTVTEGGVLYDLELSRSVALPINLADAIFIMEECNCDTSIGYPVLNDENWVLYCCPEYPVWDNRVNRNNGNVSISEFG